MNTYQFRNILNSHTNIDLKAIARMLRIKGFSSWPKRKLIDNIIKEYDDLSTISKDGEKIYKISKFLSAYVPKDSTYNVQNTARLQKKYKKLNVKRKR